MTDAGQVGSSRSRGARIAIDVDERRMDVDLTDDEIADRAAAYDLPATPGVLAKYAALVSSASEGAVANPALGRRPVHQQIHEESRA